MEPKAQFQASGKREDHSVRFLARMLILGGGLLMAALLALMVVGSRKSKELAPVPPAELFQNPEHYAEGKIPATELEKQAYGDYLKGLKEVDIKKPFGEERHRQENEVALAVARKYHMPPKSLAYLVLKLGYREVPTGDYVLPSEPD